MWSPRVNFGLLLEGGYSFRETVFKMVCRMLLDRCLSVLFVCLSLYCGQMVGWIKMPLGMVVGLGPGDIVLGGDPAPPHKGAHQPPPLFRPTALVWSLISATAECLLDNRYLTHYLSDSNKIWQCLGSGKGKLIP